MIDDSEQESHGQVDILGHWDVYVIVVIIMLVFDPKRGLHGG